MGNALIRETFVVDVNDIRFEFVASTGNRLSQVAASISVPAGAISIYHGPGATTFRQLSMKTDSDVRERLVSALRSLESHLAFSAQGAIVSFSWDKVETEMIPDKPGETTPVKKVGHMSQYPQLEAGLGEGLLQMAARATQSHRRTELAKSFWREAQREFQDQRYIQAYYNYFFVLEGLYAPGKSDPKRVV